MFFKSFIININLSHPLCPQVRKETRKKTFNYPSSFVFGSLWENLPSLSSGKSSTGLNSWKRFTTSRGIGGGFSTGGKIVPCVLWMIITHNKTNEDTAMFKSQIILCKVMKKTNGSLPRFYIYSSNAQLAIFKAWRRVLDNNLFVTFFALRSHTVKMLFLFQKGCYKSDLYFLAETDEIQQFFRKLFNPSNVLSYVE